jgi:hypothetical protein
MTFYDHCLHFVMDVDAVAVVVVALVVGGVTLNSVVVVPISDVVAVDVDDAIVVGLNVDDVLAVVDAVSL